LKNGKSKNEIYKGVKFEFHDPYSSYGFGDVRNASTKYAVLLIADRIMLSYTQNTLSKLYGVPCYRVKNSIANGLRFIFFRNFLVFEQLRLTQLLRDHGLISWFFQLQEHSHKLYVAHLEVNTTQVAESGSSYISNMNLVPVYSVWFAFNLIGVVVFCVERNCNCDRHFLRNWIFLAWHNTKTNSFVRGSVLLLCIFMKSVGAFHNYVVGFNLFKKSPIVQLHKDMKRFSKLRIRN
jgi:hypothetical protein